MKNRKFATVTVQLDYQDGGGGVPSVSAIERFIADAIQQHRYEAGQGGAIAHGDYTVTNVTIFPNG